MKNTIKAALTSAILLTLTSCDNTVAKVNAEIKAVKAEVTETVEDFIVELNKPTPVPFKFSKAASDRADSGKQMSDRMMIQAMNDNKQSK